MAKCQTCGKCRCECQCRVYTIAEIECACQQLTDSMARAADKIIAALLAARPIVNSTRRK